MKWWEVIIDSDGYCTSERFKTYKEAWDFVNRIREKSEETHVSNGPYEVDTQSKLFWSTEE